MHTLVRVCKQHKQGHKYEKGVTQCYGYMIVSQCKLYSREISHLIRQMVKWGSEKASFFISLSETHSQTHWHGAQKNLQSSQVSHRPLGEWKRKCMHRIQQTFIQTHTDIKIIKTKKMTSIHLGQHIDSFYHTTMILMLFWALSSGRHWFWFLSPCAKEVVRN